MGSSSSKFRKHLQNGDEYAALQLYNSSGDLRKGLDPNSSYGDNYNHDTPLHYAARHGMKSLMRIFLFELGGNPNKKNARNETAVHCVCMANNGRNFVVQQRRSECLTLLLKWRGATLADGEIERADLAGQDNKQNTALHYCAASGLKRCVELLVSQSSPLFIENEQKQTPCDCAEKCGQSEIALYLESKMVFCHNEEENVEEMDTMLDQMELEEGYSGLRAQDLQEAKDQLLVETSDMLQIPLFTAEALLRNNEWSREVLLEAWMEDPVTCCENCGVTPPGGLSSLERKSEEDQDDFTPPAVFISAPADEIVCDICACLIPSSEDLVPMSCDHQFCRSCWKRYLSGKIKEGEAHNITCPGYECSKLVPVDIIETLVSRDMARRYLQFDIKAFVESNPSIKWCPYPGCGRAVRLPDTDNPMSPTLRGLDDMTTLDTSHAVDCGNGHIFCWECLGEAHEPASCENWNLWHKKIGKVKPEEMSGTEEETELAANCLWLITNSKTCPNCKSPIQKNEGCNHMKCCKCKYDFCWVCLEPWKKHSSATGGYFRCNRYEVVKKVEDVHDMLKSEAEARNKRMQELNRFVHYYTRFANHENSYKLEEPLLNTAKEKMMVLAKAFTDPESANLETKFVEDTVNQLLKARRVLKCSYVYGFYLEETGYKKPIFEFMQTELEECTETLSEMIARPYLRTPRHKIIQTAHLVQRKRHEFVTAIAKGLVPPDSSPPGKKKRKKFTVELDDLDPANPWVKDQAGRHTNVSALLDWPEESDESDEEAPASPPLASLSTPPSHPSHSTGIAGCIRKGCNRGRAQNPRTGEIHDHCSLRCMRMDRMEQNKECTSSPGEYFSDYQMDLLRALEMSRLQFLQEMGSLHLGSDDRSRYDSGQGISREEEEETENSLPNPLLSDIPQVQRETEMDDTTQIKGASQLESGIDNELEQAFDMSCLSLHGEDQDLRLAIELSLQEASNKTETLEKQEPLVTCDESSTRVDETPFSPDYSTVVNRVPNKSVEDLATQSRSNGAHKTQDVGIINTNEYLGACSGITTDMHLNVDRINDSSLTNRRSKSYNHIVSQRGQSNSECLCSHQHTMPNSFGLIKDISVSNIVAADVDKTKNFADKDFSRVFHKKSLPSELNVDENTFCGEVWYSNRAKESCCNVATPMDDPWLRQVPTPQQSPRPLSVAWDQAPSSENVGSRTYRVYSDSVCPGIRDNELVADSMSSDLSCTAGCNLSPVGSNLCDEDNVDPADLVISSQILESLLQGAEHYTTIRGDDQNTSPLCGGMSSMTSSHSPTDTENPSLNQSTEFDGQTQQEQDSDAVFV